MRAKYARAYAVHDLHLARVLCGVKCSGPAMAGIFDKNINAVALGQIDRQYMWREVSDMQAGAVDYLRRYCRAAGVGQGAVSRHKMPSHMLAPRRLASVATCARKQ